MTRLLGVLLAAGTAACGGPARGADPAHVAPWLRADRQRCLIPRDLSEDMETMARRCAETFVLENGYTDHPAEDSTRWVHEETDAVAWPLLLAMRSGSLESHASAWQCSMRECIVFFRLQRPMVACTYRAVSMTQVFTKLHLTPGAIRDARCYERQA